jgi:amino acid adenylation domain-containing protein/thioester reductase-like protein
VPYALTTSATNPLPQKGSSGIRVLSECVRHDHEPLRTQSSSSITRLPPQASCSRIAFADSQPSLPTDARASCILSNNVVILVAYVRNWKADLLVAAPTKHWSGWGGNLAGDRSTGNPSPGYSGPVLDVNWTTTNTNFSSTLELDASLATKEEIGRVPFAPIAADAAAAIRKHCAEWAIDRNIFFLAVCHAWLSRLTANSETCLLIPIPDVPAGGKCWRRSLGQLLPRTPLVDGVLQIELNEVRAPAIAISAAEAKGNIAFLYRQTPSEMAIVSILPEGAGYGNIVAIEIDDARNEPQIGLIIRGALADLEAGWLSDSLIAFLVGVARDPQNQWPWLLSPSFFARYSGIEDHARIVARDTPQFLIDLIESRALEFPNDVAVRHRGTVTSNKMLDQRAAAIADALVSAGQGPGHVVAAVLARGADLIATLLAAFKIGATFCPLDCDDPPARLCDLIQRSGATALIVAEPEERSFPSSVKLIALSEDMPGPKDAAVFVAARRQAGSKHPAYIVFTSGSTGTPKAVLLAQHALESLVRAKLEAHSLGRNSKVGQTSGVSFDAFAEQVLMALAAGAELRIVAHSEITRDGFRALVSEGVEHFVLVPSLIEDLDPALADGKQGTLVVSVGEECPLSLVERWHRTVRFANAYGPAEATVCSHWWEAGGDRCPGPLAPVGRPLPGVTGYVLDEFLQPAALGQIGEIYIGGTGVAVGYVGEPQETARAFLPDPFIALSGARMYRTGDLGRINSEGILEFLGRADRQTSFLGVRVEPAEIETALRRHEGVRRAAVLPQLDADGKRSFVAYFEAEPLWRAAELEAAAVESWTALGAGADANSAATDGYYDAAGWRSSLTGQRFEPFEMDEWWSQTVAAIRSLKPRRLLDIGCGNAQLFDRLAAELEHYEGIDIDAPQLERARRRLRAGPVSCESSVRQATAGDLRPVDFAGFDTVVLNSAVQYFPSLPYLEAVLAQAVAGMSQGGKVFIGDIRDFRLLPEYLASVQLTRVAPDETFSGLRAAVAAATLRTEELCIDPVAFLAFAKKSPRSVHVSIRMKHGWTNNELTRYRYDVVLHVASPKNAVLPIDDATRREFCGLAALNASLSEERYPIAISCIPNARLGADVGLAQALDAAEPDACVLACLSDRNEDRDAERFVDPEALVSLAGRHGFEVHLDPLSAAGRYAFDAVFLPSGDTRVPVRMLGEGTLPAVASNVPTALRRGSALIQELRRSLAAALPTRLLPANYVPLAVWPTNRNGKLDRSALASLAGTHSRRPPSLASDPASELIAQMMAHLLSRSLGPDDDFFSSGGHSLLAVRLIARISEVLSIQLPVRTIFEAPSPRALSKRLFTNRTEPASHVADDLPLERRPDGTPHLVSSPQKRLWFLEKLMPGSGAQTVAVALRIEGPLDRDALRQSVETILLRHETLRSRFVENDGDAAVEMCHPSEFEFERLDLSALSNWEAPARDAVRAFSRRAFDLRAGELVRGKLICVGIEDHIVAFSLHHIVADGWSVSVFVRELIEGLHAFSTGGRPVLQPLPIRYSDWAAWQKKLSKSVREQALLTFWEEQLRDVEPVALPVDRPMLASRSFETGIVARPISGAVRENLRRLCGLRSVTPFMVHLTSLALLLNKITNQRDVTLGSPVANRDNPMLEGLIGFFANTVVYRIDTGGLTTFSELLARVRRIVLDVHAHQDMRFERLVEELHPPRNIGRTPFFDVWISHVVIDAEMPSCSALRISPFEVESGRGPFPLGLTIIERPDAAVWVWEYSRDLFDQRTAEHLAERYESLLEQALSEQDFLLASASIVSPRERHQLICWGTGSAAPPIPLGVLITKVAEIAIADPLRRAVSDATVDINYQTLDARAAWLAGKLIGGGVTAGTVCGVLLGRTCDLPIAYLAILRIGGVLLPLDPALPTGRLALMVSDAAPAIIVADAAHAALGRSLSSRVLVFTEEDQRPAPRPHSPTYSDDGAAYIIYTSGSTGKPKGVVVGRAALAGLLTSFQTRLGLRPGQAVLATTSIGFDISMLEILLPLSAGTQMFIDSSLIFRDGLAFSNVIARRGIALVQGTPSSFLTLLAAGWEGSPALEILVGGEPLQTALRDRLTRRSARLHNVYGPTETTIWSTAADTAKTSEVTIGRPLPGTRCYVLNDALEFVPVGVTGELYIGGIGVAFGYHDAPAATSARFLPDPFAGKGQRMYRTGDRVLWSSAGELRFLGRDDRQIKLMGERFELGEIECVLAACPHVVEAVAIVTGAEEERRLVAFLVYESGIAPNIVDIERRLSDVLPAMARPTRLIALDALPITSNGKRDVGRLEQLATKENIEPATGIGFTQGEAQLAQLWSRVLGRYPKSRSADFFDDLGGHSLAAVRVTAAIRDELLIDFPLRQIFLTSRLCDQAAAIRDLSGSVFSRLVRVTKTTPEPASQLQQRLWIQHQLSPRSAALNVGVAIVLDTRIEPRRLLSVLQRIVEREEILRTAFRRDETVLLQIVEPVVDVPLAFEDEAGSSELDLNPEVRHKVDAFMRRPFDPGRAPLLRALLVNGEGCCVLAISAHHMIADIRTIELVLEACAADYHGVPGDISEPSRAYYRDFARWEAERLAAGAWASQEAFWRERLQSLKPAYLATDRPRIPARSSSGYRLYRRIPKAGWRSVCEFARRERVAPSTLVLGAFGLVLRRYVGHDTFSIAMPVSLRDFPGAERMLGPLINAVLVAMQGDRELTVSEWLRHVESGVREALSNKDVPLEHALSGSKARAALTEVAFAWNAETPQVSPFGAAVRPLLTDTLASQFEIALSGATEAGALLLIFEYNADLFDRGRIERLMGHTIRAIFNMARSPGALAHSLNFLTPREMCRLRLLEVGEKADVKAHAEPVTITIDGQAQLAPDVIAVNDGDLALTYGQLSSCSQRIAQRLRSANLGHGTAVALFMQPSAAAVVVLLGIIKAGAIYVPLNPALPAERIKEILEQSNAELAIVDVSLLSSFADFHTMEIWSADDLLRECNEIADGVGVSDGYPMDMASTAVIIFTSGSTGRPKGVMISHSNLAAVIGATAAMLDLEPGDKGLLIAPLAFDISLFEIFHPLVKGATLDVVKQRDDLGALVSSIKGAATFHAVPALMRLICNEIRGRGLAGSDFPALRTLFVGGEGVPASLLRDMSALFSQSRVHVLYGPTEASIVCTSFAVDPLAIGEGFVIGHPLPHAEIRLLDEYGMRVPLGVPGEIHIGGIAVGQGYAGAGQSTAAFYQRDGQSWYATGDFGFRRVDGTIEFLGRRDGQVKIRGMRVEIAEIEMALRRHPGIREAVVAVDQSRETVRLGAFVTLDEVNALEPELLRRSLRRQLPDYMLPAHIEVMAALPLLSTGKIDRQSLAARIVDGFRRISDDPPTGETECALAAIWSTLLELPSLGRQENIFDLGAHSLIVVEAAERIGARFGRRVALADIFLCPTIEDQARLLREHTRREIGVTQLASEGIYVPPEGPAASLPASPGDALLTGATGFLGAHLLVQLLERREGRVYCLVRGANEKDANQRLFNSLKNYGIDLEWAAPRIKTVAADLAIAGFGLSVDAWADLEVVGEIFHCAAAVDFLKPFEMLRSVNVSATRQLIDFAFRYSKVLHHVSTLGVLSSGDGTAAISELPSEQPDEIIGGYAQSKWVAERLVWSARDVGVDARIYRAGHLSGHSRTGIWRAGDFLCLVVKAIVQLGAAPDTQDEIDLTPVDCAAGRILDIASAGVAQAPIFHLVNPNVVTIGQVVHALHRLGYAIELEPKHQWLARARQRARLDFEFPLRPFVDLLTDDEPERSTARKLVYDFENTKMVLGADFGIMPPAAELLPIYLRSLIGHDIIDPPMPRI